jgi:NAD(P)H dehydrogenase (quinone)
VQALEGGVLVHNRGRGRVAYVARDDCAAAAAAALLQTRYDGAVYDITGEVLFSAAELAALYGEIGGRPVAAQAVDDAAFVGRLVGESAGDDHLRYGAELVASFGRAIREGYLDVCSGDVAQLTGRAPRTLREVLAPHLQSFSPSRP